MIPEGEALLRAVAGTAYNNPVRLIHADWLEEHGDTDRAEFIRVQVEMESLIPAPVEHPGEDGICPECGKDVGYASPYHYHCRYCRAETRLPGCRRPECLAKSNRHLELNLREGQLLSTLISTWLPGWRVGNLIKGKWISLVEEVRMGRTGGITLECGIITTIGLPLPTWQEHDRALVRAHLLERVELTDRQPELVAGGWWWYDMNEGPENNGPSNLPLDVFLLLPNSREGVAWYSSNHEGAIVALSDALLTRARRR